VALLTGHLAYYIFFNVLFNALAYSQKVTMKVLFSNFAAKVSSFAGSPYAAMTAFVLVITWLFGGLYFGFGDTYQLIINTGTTIITFLMVFLIQSSQNRDTKAIHLKLDELILAKKSANNTVIAVESKSEEEIEELKTEVIAAKTAAQNAQQNK
jgi:low affinity Fe/Cu permease